MNGVSLTRLGDAWPAWTAGVKNLLSSRRLVLIQVATGLATLFVAKKVVKLLAMRRRYQHIPGPATKGLIGFFFGNFDFAEMIKEGKTIADYLVEWQKEYGDTFKFQLLDRIVLYTGSVEAIKENLAMKSYPIDQVIVKVMGYPLNLRLLGRGLITEPDNQVFKHRRALFSPAFSRNAIISWIDQFNETASILMEKLRKSADGQTPVVLLEDFNQATLDALSKIAFGIDIDTINNPDSPISQSLRDINLLMDVSLSDPFFKLKINKRGQWRNHQQSVKFLREMAKSKIEEKIRELQKGDDIIGKDILSIIIKSVLDDSSANNKLDMETMIDDFVTFYFAGQETTANSLAFSIIELGKNPDCMEKLREEVDRVLGERGEITSKDVSELVYCSAVFKESLRLWPAVAMTNRLIDEETIIDGHRVPKDTLLFVSSYSNARQEKYFKDPYKFKPERFLKVNEHSEVPNYAYFPFSVGHRTCIGKNFAQMEATIILAKLIQRFEIKLDPNQSFGFAQIVSVKPKDGVRCFLKLRSSS